MFSKVKEDRLQTAVALQMCLSTPWLGQQLVRDFLHGKLCMFSFSELNILQILNSSQQ